jgi:hypothetical protein
MSPNEKDMLNKPEDESSVKAEIASHDDEKG